MTAKTLFISYSHADAALVTTLKTHLKPLERGGIIKPWFDGYLMAGDDIDAKVRDALENAEIVALVVSPDFLASDYCYDVEMKEAVRRHERGNARVIPIIARQCQWHGAPFGRLKAVPDDGKPIMSAHWTDKDSAWNIVATAIGAAANAQVEEARTSRSDVAVLSSVTGGRAPMAVRAPKQFTDRDKDEFKHAAFDEIASSFQVSLDHLSEPLAGSFRRIDANRFTATIYQSGKKVSGCTIWIGGGSFGSNAVCYLANDSAETNSMNDWLSVEVEDNSLVLQPHMASIGSREKSGLDAAAAAAHLWARFTQRF